MKTTYKVTGRGFMGHKPGEEFDADLDEATEARALERGSIEVVGRGKKTAKTKQEEESDA